MELQCRFYRDNLLNYACEVQKIAEVTPGSSKLSFDGSHLRAGYGIFANDDVTHFSINQLRLKAFPRDLHQTYKNLTHITITDCGIKQISKEDLVGFANIKSLNLSKNMLTLLPDNLFVSMRRLREINFCDNKIESLSSALLKPIEALLDRADFERNTKINASFNKNVASKNNLDHLMELMDSTKPVPFEWKKRNDRQLEHHQQAATNLAAFRASGEFTDFTIRVRGKEFKAHKAILAAHSPVFRQAFASNEGTSENTFTKVKNFSEESFGSFLDFFYSGKVGDEANVLEVLELATVFEVAILKEICSDKISATLTESKVN